MGVFKGFFAFIFLKLTTVFERLNWGRGKGLKYLTQTCQKVFMQVGLLTKVAENEFPCMMHVFQM